MGAQPLVLPTDSPALPWLELVWGRLGYQRPIRSRDAVSPGSPGIRSEIVKRTGTNQRLSVVFAASDGSSAKPFLVRPATAWPKGLWTKTFPTTSPRVS